ncbi:hypothetical protein J6590_068172 [Homalodisca vitripennis]|nr:hypothetical protein J6590_090489 [Homalodisca vitripennis]KAG8261632.1 hypothetical protein J6590_068172 [Homalodisca vitripennis]
MDLNICKSAILKYTRSNAPITFNYQLNGNDLSRVNTLKDLEYLETPLDALRPSLGLLLLSTRRKVDDVMLSHKIVNGYTFTRHVLQACLTLSLNPTQRHSSADERGE